MRRRWMRVAAGISVGALAVTTAGVPAVAAPRDSDDRSGWSEEQRRAHGAEIAPDVPATEVVPSEVATPDAPAPHEQPPAASPVAGRYPLAATTVLRLADGGAAARPADSSGFSVRASRVRTTPGKAGTVGRLNAGVLDEASARRAGVNGVLLHLTNPTADAAQVDLAIDYPALAAWGGSDWSARAQLVRLPECALTTPEDPDCRKQTPVETAEYDAAGTQVTARVDADALGVMALSAGASGSTGDWSATPLSASAAWQVSAQTGAFSWSYPMRVPPSVGGPEPALSLDYSAASIDGRVVTSNNQTSWVGEGWGLETGYVERKYATCADDMTGGNNATHETWDLCWKNDNATLVFNGQAMELVKDVTTGQWRPADDDGTRVEHLTDADNGDEDGEYWKVTTTDGTQYFFGRGRRPTDDLVLNSAWTVPVFGNHPGEPGHASSFASSWDVQAWRWNLDYVVDTSGNTMTYVYAKETNYYGRDLGEAVSGYVRGGYLTSIEYGQREGGESTSSAPFKVVFAVAERCIPSGAITCAPSQLTDANKTHWPDVPYDLICASSTSCPSQVSPAFFTRKRLTAVTTQVLTGATYRDVDRWALTQTFPDPGDATGRSLFLERISHQGLAGDPPLTLPDVTFTGIQMPNRVDVIGDYGPPMNRFRVAGITTESGAALSVNYTPQDCTPTSLPASPATNTRRCMPVVWDPEGGIGPITEYFHKYLVESVVATPHLDSASVVTSYIYRDGAAWRYDDSPLTPAKYRTWGDFRGYGTVDVVTGADYEPERTITRYRYFRGMHGDRSAGGGTKSVTVDGAFSDYDWLNGFLREETTYDGIDTTGQIGPELSATVNDPWQSDARATGADGTTSRFVNTAASVGRVTAPAVPGGVRTTRVEHTYDSYGMPATVSDLGDTSTTADDRCTVTQYARTATPATYIVDTVNRVETLAVGCDDLDSASRPGDVISDVRTWYDGQAYGVAPTDGLATRVERVASYAGSTPVYVTEATTAYDDHGRPVAVGDALGRTATTAFTPAAGGPVTAATTTSPDPDGSGPLTAHVTLTEVDPAWGAATRVTDPSGKVTSATYDALGRLTAVWLPGRAKGTKTANTTYEYAIPGTGINTVTTRTLTASEGYLTSVGIYDGLLRARQTQSPSLDRDTPGRVVTDTVYDSRGLVAYANGEWFTAGAPGAELVVPTAEVPARTRMEYDGAGRTTAEIFDVDHDERWRTTTTYGGDRVSVDPPTGAVPTTTITDARGQTTELRQYTGTGPTGAFQATSYAFDHAGRLAGMTDAAGNEWSYSYDLRGRQVSASDPDKGTTTTSYDDAGQVLTVTDARGETLANVYDALGRRTELRDETPTGALRARWVYDTLQGAKGQLTSTTRYAGGAQYVTAITGYDDGYRPLGQSVTIPAAEGALAGTYTTTYTYAPNGQPKTTKYPSAGGLGVETVTTYYDDLSLPSWLSGGLGWGVYVAGSDYSSLGRPMQYDLGNTYSFFVDYDYEHGTRRRAGTSVYVEGASGMAMDVTYTYDDAGNPTSITDAPASGPGDAQCFAYDGLRRLTQAWTPTNGNCSTAPSVAGLGGAAPYWFTDTFNPIGNRTARVVHATGGDTTTTYTYPTSGGHRLTSTTSTGPTGTTTNTYVYDNGGNTTNRTITGTPSQTLTWDAEGELTSASDGATTDTYTYTADGDRLIRRQDGATTVYLPSGQELTLANGTVKATRYYTFNGTVVAVRTAPRAAGVTTLVSDNHGTAELAVANTTRVITRRYTDPYGKPRGTAPTTWAGDHGYLDKPSDTTGLIAIGARYYDPVTARFISVDPVMDLTDPQQWHGYAYANNNPITNSDPTGQAPVIGDWDRAPRRPAKEVTPAQRYYGITSRWAQERYQRRRFSEMGVAANHAHRMLKELKASSFAKAHTNPDPRDAVMINAAIPAGMGARDGDAGSIAQAVAIGTNTRGSAAIQFLFELEERFGDGEEWDAKVRLRSELGIPDNYWLPMGQGQEMNYDVFGNVIYGYMMEGFGVTPENAVLASHSTHDAGRTFRHDDASILVGYTLAERHPDGFTANEFYEFLTSPEIMEDLNARVR